MGEDLAPEVAAVRGVILGSTLLMTQCST